MPFVLINADDFGVTPGVTQGIIACSANGVALSTSAMTCIDGAEALIRDSAYRFCGGIGLHLQLTQGAPALAPSEIPTLVEADGRFPARRVRTSLDPRDTAREWRAQLARLRSWGVEPDHLDSHHHVHARREADEPLLPVYADLARETSLPVRGGTRAVARFLRTRGVVCPDVTVFLSEHEKSTDALVHALEAERAEGPTDLVVEVCCHPGFVDALLPERTLPKYLATREPELKLLLDPDTHKRLRAFGWETIPFSQLKDLRATGAPPPR